MYLILEDIATDTTVVKIQVNQHDEGYWFVDFDSPIYHNFAFQIDCALYGLNEGQVTTDTIEDDDGIEYVRWFILNDFVEVVECDDGGYIAQFFDKVGTTDEVIVYDEFYNDKNEVETCLSDYIKAQLFGIVGNFGEMFQKFETLNVNKK